MHTTDSLARTVWPTDRGRRIRLEERRAAAHVIVDSDLHDEPALTALGATWAAQNGQRPPYIDLFAKR
jgi:hypothetical protein